MKKLFLEGCAPMGAAFLLDGFGSPVGDLAAAGASLIGSAINAHTSSKNTKRMIAAQREENEKAYQRNLEMWNKENAYNAPSEVIERLRKAGMNPALAYGTPNVSAPAPDAPITDMSPLASMPSPFGAALESLPSARYLNALVENVKADTRKKESDATGQDISNERQEIALRVDKELENDRISMYGLELEHLAGELLIQDDTRNLLLQQAKYSQGLTAYLEASVDKINQDISESKSRTVLNRIDSYTRNAYNSSVIRYNNALSNVSEREYTELVATFLERHGIQIQAFESASKRLQMFEQNLKKSIEDNDYNAIEHWSSILSDIAGTASEAVKAVGLYDNLGLPSLDDYVEDIETTKKNGRTYTRKTMHKVKNSWSD